MKSKLRIRWAIAGCIWLTATGVTGWNLAKIEEVAAARHATESMRREIHFQRHNAERLAQLVADQEALYLGVESLDLGMVELRERVRGLAAAFGLEDLSLEAEMNQAVEGEMACRLSLTGAFENTVGFLTALKEYPYLAPRQIVIGAVADAQTVRLEISFSVQYKLVAPATPAVPLPKVTSQPLELEGRPL